MSRIERVIPVFILSMCICIAMPPCSQAGDCNALLNKANKTVMVLQKRKILEEAIKKCPENPEVNYQYGYCLERLRKYEEAAKWYRKAVKYDTSQKTAKYYFGLGDVLRLSGKFAEARKAYETGLKIEPGNKRAEASLKEVEGKLVAVQKQTVAKKQVKKQAANISLKPATPSNLKVDTRKMKGNLARSGASTVKLVSKYASDMKATAKIDNKTW
jgi:tetratricopeptide (TPR) repeat protein